MNPTEVIYPGLEGVLAGETAISTITKGLQYRGYSVVDLAEKCSFEEVAHLLLHGELPSAPELSAFKARLAAAQAFPPLLNEVIARTPASAHSMDVVRTGVSILACHDPETEDYSEAANLRKAERLLAQIPLIIGALWRCRQGQKPLTPSPELSFAAQVLYLIKGEKPSEFAARAMDVSLTMYAEHEYNASTFAARVVCSTESDLHSSVVAAIGALKGRLHGGANEKVMDLLAAAGGADKADSWIRDALKRKEKIMGFGHRVYKAGDVRAGVLKKWAAQAATTPMAQDAEKAAEIIENVMAAQKNLFPNLDWPAGRLFFSLGLDPAVYTPLFVASRVTGWSAHVIEQMRKNRIIRPRGKYVGLEDRIVAPLASRPDSGTMNV